MFKFSCVHVLRKKPTILEMIKKLILIIIDYYDIFIAKRRDKDPNKVLIEHEEILKEYSL